MNTPPVPKGISGDFLTSSYSEFITQYDINLSRFFEYYRLIYNQENQDPVETEKDFITYIIKFLDLRNKELQEQDQKRTEDFFSKKDLPQDELLQLHQKNRELSEEFLSYNYKMHFLSVKIRRLGFEVDLTGGITFNEIKSEETEPEEILNGLSGPEKLVYLNELGILEFLKQKYPNVSQNKLASVLSRITGVRNLRPTLQAMESDHNRINLKNPYNNKKTATRVKTQLIQWGFKIMSKENK
jgi:hypothetical protein